MIWTGFSGERRDPWPFWFLSTCFTPVVYPWNRSKRFVFYKYLKRFILIFNKLVLLSAEEWKGAHFSKFPTTSVFCRCVSLQNIFNILTLRMYKPLNKCQHWKTEFIKWRLLDYLRSKNDINTNNEQFFQKKLSYHNIGLISWTPCFIS